MKRLAFLLLPLLLHSPAVAQESEHQPIPVERLLVDFPPIEFEATDLHGESVALSDFRGKVVVLNFWGIWCPPCRVEIPELLEMYHVLQGDGLEIVSVNTDGERDIVPPFVEKNEISFPVVFDDGASDLYEVISYPTSFVLDRRGRIRYVSEGYHPGTVADLQRIVEHILREPYQSGRDD